MRFPGPAFTPLDDTLAGLGEGTTVWWGCEYVMPTGVDGHEYHLVRDLDTERPERVELTLGVGTTVAALELTVPRACCDGIVLLDRDPDWSLAPFDPTVAYPDLVWAGPPDHPGFATHVDDSCGLQAIPAVSFPALGALVALELSLVRPDLVLAYDPGNDHHASPTVRWLQDNLDDERYTIAPAEPGRPEVQVSGQVMDVLLALELDHAEQLDALAPAERDALEVAAAWLAWTDGTYRPDGTP